MTPTINQIAFGDGVLDVCDVYVTFRRSLDTNNLVWFQRFWTNGFRVATASYAPGIEPAAKSSGGGKVQAAFSSSSAPRFHHQQAGREFHGGRFSSRRRPAVSIPVTAAVFGPYPLRVAMLNISVVPLDGSPALTTPISFTPTGTGHRPLHHHFRWAKQLRRRLAEQRHHRHLKQRNHRHAEHHHSGHRHQPSPLMRFILTTPPVRPTAWLRCPKTTLTGLITLSSRNTSSYNDGIPDSWRLRWFGTIYNLLSVSNACPSGDGVNNWKKYVAGVDPNTPNDFPSLNPLTPPSSGAAMSIYWPTVSGKQYQILSSASLFPGTWTTNAIVTGNGDNMEFDDNTGGPQKYYRVQILP